jgi:hypothetical protein
MTEILVIDVGSREEKGICSSLTNVRINPRVVFTCSFTWSIFYSLAMSSYLLSSRKDFGPYSEHFWDLLNCPEFCTEAGWFPFPAPRRVGKKLKVGSKIVD